VLMAAPTGRAAKRMTESTGRNATTIHRLLEALHVGYEFQRDAENPLDCQMLILDETSMLDVWLMSSVLDALPADSGLLLVGDKDQLPSVGPGQILGDIIGSGAIPVVELTEVFRQAKGSRIISNAHRVNSGMLPETAAKGDLDSDFFFWQVEDMDRVCDCVVELVCERIPNTFGHDPVNHIQVLCPRNGGSLGTRMLNHKLQHRLNPPSDSSSEVERAGYVFRTHDKVMVLVNDYDRQVYNGDFGWVANVNTEETNVVIEIDGRRHKYDFKELDEIALAYAITIHKSQGSEYPAVVLAMSMQAYTMLQRNLLYTGMTRGKELVVVVGEPRAVARAVKTQESIRRWTKLKDFLQEEGGVVTS
ncbi:hypothetical protein CYMTET_22978, partial [Cymbomonas tetramitiformis]